ncbi:MAG: hypothetical protein CVV21_01140 [Candidatus Goldiibacteriota bacterium HGW-Goldbacteria-1]|jgi:hypothetical protein|nr:MAG: hypothetical protein CVV21_01140 [Candidatus Goldiibacteriota bacterium HGW-Goldbacteria-1]
MNLTKEQAKQELQKLVDLFEKEMKSGEAMELNEANTKSTFIEPLLRLLGWDTNNHNEVCLEDAISRKRVDYSVRYNGRVEFFVEAKQVSVNLEDKKFINQAIGYGYSRKDVPFVVLTDFEGFKLFDVTVKPDIRNIRKGIKLDLNWKQYVDKFDDLWMLSKESVINGDLNKLLSTKPKDRVPVDKAVLNDLKVWREHLAKDIYKNNPDLFHSGDLERDADYLKEINQKLLDRIVFMRSCEDRGLVAGHSLRALFEDRSDSLGTRTMQVILDKEFAFYNRIFDSELFRPQDWEKDLKIEFKTLNAIIEDTYNPYQFDAIPLEVLGNIYEQFLGYTIRVTDKQVKYEEKPDVRKAGGVYYTPEYIVDYIVKNTVGKKLAELKEKDIKKLRILDPACGSGSFLIRAYEEMLNWYRDLKRKQSTEKADKQSQDKLFEQGKQQGDVLNIAEKAEILKRHIFGVDLDEQAVEVTKLSLVLKMLEGEFVPIGGQGVLPMLNQNIKCGNSLISGDPLLLTRYFGNDYYKIKPFNWEEQYKEVMAEGGFDCVIGNPPYIGFQGFKKEKEFYTDVYSSAKGKFDIYVLFIEKGIKIINKNGLMSYICPTGFMKRNHGIELRKYILNNVNVEEIIDFEHESIFKDALNYTGIFIFSKSKAKDNMLKYKIGLNGKLEYYPQKELGEGLWIFRNPLETKIIEKINKLDNVKKLIEVTDDITEGIVTGLNDIYLLDSETIKNNKIEKTFLKPCIRGRNIRKYYLDAVDEYVFYPYDVNNDLIPEKEIKAKAPNYYKFLTSNKTEINKREYFTKSSKKWYELWNQRKTKNFTNIKIIVPELAESNRFMIDDKGYYYGDTVCGFYFEEKADVDIYYILGILNSRLMEWYYKKTTVPKANEFFIYKTMFLKNLPIFVIDKKDEAQVVRQKRISDLVKTVLLLSSQLNNNRKGAQGNQIDKEIDSVMQKIDEEIYGLYKISQEEVELIKVISNKNREV